MCLVRYFSGDVKSWLNLQMAYDIKIAEARKKNAIEREIVPKEA